MYVKNKASDRFLYFKKYSSTHSGNMAMVTTKLVVKQLAEKTIRMKKRVISKVEFVLKKKHAIKKGKAVYYRKRIKFN